MVFDPPKEKVDVTLLIVLSFIPIVFMYAFWRIQKFWLLTIILVIVEGTIWIPFLVFGFIISWQISLILFVGGYIALNVFLVNHFAKKYNQKLESSNNLITSETKQHLKKNKSFFIIIAGIFGVIVLLTAFFVFPELTKNDIQNNIQEDLSEDEERALDILMNYKGTNQVGLSVIDTISNMIEEKYPNENIFDNEKTKTDIIVTNVNSSSYKIDLNFESYKGKSNYSWNVNTENFHIEGNNQESKNIIELVDYG